MVAHSHPHPAGHPHEHPHEHPHAHGDPHAGYDRVHTEPVVLDIGGEIGALVLYTDAERDGHEIELSPIGCDAARFHNQVHERRFNGRSVYAAVYPQIRAGEYTIWGEASPAGHVTILGGQVATVDWRS